MTGREPGASAKRSTSLWPAYVFGAIGLLLLSWGLYQSVRRTVVLLAWPEARGEVVASTVEKSGNAYRAVIRVRFDTGSETIVTEVENDYRGKAFGWIAEAVETHKQGTTAIVRYNRRHPETAVLDPRFGFRTFGLPLLTMLGGLVFAGVGLLAHRSAKLNAAEALASDAKEGERLARLEYLGVGAFVLLIGVAMTIAGLAILPSKLESRHWPVVDARFDHGEVIAKSSTVGKGRHTTYSPRLHVSYGYEGRSYSSTIDLPRSKGRREAVERLIADMRPGEIHRVRVNPEHPHRIERAESMPLVLPVVFVLAGFVVSAVAVLVIRSAPSAKSPKRRN